MITNNYLNDMLANISLNSGNTTNNKSIDLAASQNQFKETLSKSLKDDTTNRSYFEKTSKSNYNDEVRQKEYRPIKSNSEEQNDINKSTDDRLNKEVNNSSEDESIKKDKTKEKNETKEDTILQTFAEVLGLSKDELADLFKQLGINPEEISDEQKLGEKINEITNLLNLSNDEKNALTEIFKSIQAEIENLTNSGTDELKNMKAVNTDVPELTKDLNTDSNIEVIDLRNQRTLDEQLISKFKSKLEELVNDLEKDPDNLNNRVADSLKCALSMDETVETGLDEISDIKISDRNVLKDQDFLESPVTEEVSDDMIIETKNTGESDNKGSDSFNDSVLLSGQNQEISQGTGNPGNGLQFNNVLSNQIKDNTEVTTPFREVNISKNEIINQVIDKAKVVLTDDKSEMVMELKPESLGKVSLRIITERGLVMAKFVAESEQVKAILETNMQLLKDSLEKQGMTVQGFSVSVGDNSSRQFENQNNQSDSNKGQSRDKDGVIKGNLAGLSQITESQKRINPYEVVESSINLTA